MATCKERRRSVTGVKVLKSKDFSLHSRGGVMQENVPAVLVVCTSLKDVRLSFLAMNFLRWRTVACAEQRIHLRFRPRSLLLLHSKQMLTWRWKQNRNMSADIRWGTSKKTPVAACFS